MYLHNLIHFDGIQFNFNHFHYKSTCNLNSNNCGELHCTLHFYKEYKVIPFALLHFNISTLVQHDCRIQFFIYTPPRYSAFNNAILSALLA